MCLTTTSSAPSARSSCRRVSYPRSGHAEDERIRKKGCRVAAEAAELWSWVRSFGSLQGGPLAPTHDLLEWRTRNVRPHRYLGRRAGQCRTAAVQLQRLAETSHDAPRFGGAASKRQRGARIERLKGSGESWSETCRIRPLNRGMQLIISVRLLQYVHVQGSWTTVPASAYGWLGLCGYQTPPLLVDAPHSRSVSHPPLKMRT